LPSREGDIAALTCSHLEQAELAISWGLRGFRGDRVEGGPARL